MVSEVVRDIAQIDCPVGSLIITRSRRVTESTSLQYVGHTEIENKRNF
jgi:hypothetical protein